MSKSSLKTIENDRKHVKKGEDLRIDTAHVKSKVKESYAAVLSVQHSSCSDVLPGILQGSILF